MLMRTNYVDFHQVEPGHFQIHARLENWARWCRGSASASSAPMFRLYRSSNARREYGAPIPASSGLDRIDAQRIAKAVAALPEKHRASVQWCYLKPVNPGKKARELGVSLADLQRLLRDARQMLVNRVSPLDTCS